MNNRIQMRKLNVLISAELPTNYVGSVIVEVADNLSDDDIEEALNENGLLLSNVCDDFTVEYGPDLPSGEPATVDDYRPAGDDDGPAVLRIERDEEGNLTVEDLYDEVQ